jgi:hypothetical protein
MAARSVSDTGWAAPSAKTVTPHSCRDASGRVLPAIAAPAELMIRPQLGSHPCMAVLTSGEFPIARAIAAASEAVSAPPT